MQQFSLDRQAAEEFLEVYKGVVTEYSVSSAAQRTAASACLLVLT